MPVSTAEVSARLGMAASAIALIFTTEYSALVGGGNSLDEVVVARAIMYLAAFGLFGLAVVPPSLKVAGLLSLASLVACLSVFYYGAIKDDEGSYTLSVHPSTHVAAEMIWQGKNPYEIRDDPAFTVAMLERFDTPAALFTRTEDGELVQQLLVYPAGHALAFVPVVAAGFTDIRWFGVTASLAVAMLIWWAAPAVLRPVAPLLVLLHPVATLNTPVILNVDAVWVLPLMAGVLALYRRSFVWAALFYGVALSMRLHPLLLAPFLCVWLWRELEGEPADRVRSVAGLMGIASGVFLLVNLPFILWSPGDWLHGVSYAIVTAQQGAVGIRELDAIGIDLSRTLYALLAGCVLLGLFVAYVRRFDVLRDTFWIYPAVVLWFTPRPLQYYTYPWMVLVLLAVVLVVRERLEPDVPSDDGLLEPVPVPV